MKINIKFCFLSTIILLLATSTNGFGGWGLPKIGGDVEKTSGVSREDAIAEQSALLKMYMAASLKITEAQILMGKAFGFKEEVEALEIQSKVLSSGNVMAKDEIEKQRAVSKKAQEKIDAKIEEGKELSADGKKNYAKSILPYSSGIVLYRAVVPVAKASLQAAQNQVGSASIMDKLKVKKTFDVALYLSPKVGPDLMNLVSTGTKYVTYAKKNNVKVPKEASDALGDDL